MLSLFAAGFAAIFTPKVLGLMIIGVAVGIIFGSIPGLTATMAVALCLPMTFGMDMISGMALLCALYIGGISGGLISAILINIPGTPASIATCFDGHPMAAKGEAGRALGIGIFYSFLGGLISFIALAFIAPPLADFALKFGPQEYFALAVFSLTMISSLSGDSIAKGLASGMVGMGLAMVGAAPIDAFPRFTFGFNALDGGFDLLPALIGLFAISEILKTAEESGNLDEGSIRDFKIKGFGFTFAEFKASFWNFIRSGIIGLGIGILPGIGGGTSNILAYTAAKNSDKNPERFGTGVMDGIVASEVANNATIGGALVPLLTLGIPGDTTTAMLLGGFMVHGLTPGPLLFTSSADVVYGIFAALIVANIIMLVMEYYGLRIFVRLLKIPKHILLPVVLALCAVGAYGLNNRVFDVWAILFFGLIGYGLMKFNFPLPPVLLGFILAPIAETNLRRGLMLTNGSFWPFLTKPIASFFLIVTVISVILSARKNIRKAREKRAKLNDTVNA